MASTTPTAPPPAPAPAKKTSPWVWVAVGCAAIIVVVLVVLGGLTFWVGHKVKGYAELAQKNPAMAAAKLMVAANPDIEIVSEDDGAGTITVRNKKTGETITMNAKDIKEGRLSFKNEKGEEMTFEGKGEGGTGSLKIHTKEGETTFGAGSAANLPGWVPSYPGAEAQGTYSASTKQGNSGGFSFKTSDSADQVMAYFESHLKSAGFEVNTSKFEQNGEVSGGIVQGAEKGGRRSVHLTVGAEKTGGTTVSVIYEEKAR